MTAIETRYISATNTRGARIKAVALATGQAVTVPYAHAEPLAAHRTAMQALMNKMGWDGEWVAGDTRRGYVWVRRAR